MMPRKCYIISSYFAFHLIFLAFSSILTSFNTDTRSMSEREYMTEDQWITHHILATTTFFGMLLTRSASTALDLTMCLFTILLIGLAAKLIAEIDLPYSYKIDRSALTYVIRLLSRTHRQLGGGGGGGIPPFNPNVVSAISKFRRSLTKSSVVEPATAASAANASTTAAAAAAATITKAAFLRRRSESSASENYDARRAAKKPFQSGAIQL